MVAPERHHEDVQPCEALQSAHLRAVLGCQQVERDRRRGIVEQMLGLEFGVPGGVLGKALPGESWNASFGINKYSPARLETKYLPSSQRRNRKGRSW